MYKTFYEGMDTLAPMLALLLFGLAFVAIVLRTLIFTRARDVEAIAQLPLVDEAPGARHE